MSKDKTKLRRPRAQTARGFRDWFGPEIALREQMLAAICEVYRRYGFDPLETPAIETVEALGKFLPDVDRPNEGVFAFQDEDETWLALRYDLTAPLARFFAENRNDLPTPFRRYAVGPVWRNEKPGPGRFRQFWQCDADSVGAASIAADAEMAAMFADVVEAAGISRGDYVIRVNSRKILNGVLEKAGLGSRSDQDPAGKDAREDITNAFTTVGRSRFDRLAPEQLQAMRADVLRTIDKFDKVGRPGVVELLTTGRRDTSGAFIDGVGLFAEEADVIADFLTAKGETVSTTITRLRDLVGDTASGAEGVRELEQIAELLAAQGYGEDRVTIDPSVVRGLGYYTGPVFEAELTFETLDARGRPMRLGSVGGGGRYDDLVARFTGQKVPAVGISVGVDRLLTALSAKGRLEAAQGPVLVCVMDRARIASAQSMTGELRAAGLRAELFLGGGNLGKQLKYADKRGCPVAVIEGEDEAAKGVVQLKDLALGARLAAEIETHEDWKAQPAQLEAPRANLVTSVRAMLARAG